MSAQSRDLRVVYDGLGLGDEERALLAQSGGEGQVAAGQTDSADGSAGEVSRRICGCASCGWRRKKRWAEADAARGPEIQVDPYADAQARTAVGELLVRLGDKVECATGVSEIVEFAPQDPALARRRLGICIGRTGCLTKRIVSMRRCFQLQPGDNSVLILLAAAAARLRQGGRSAGSGKARGRRCRAGR